MGIAETYLDKRGAAKRALADLDNMKFILEHTDEKIKMLSAQMEAGDQHSRLIKEQSDRIDDVADDGKIFGQPENTITLVMRYRQAKEYMEWFGPGLQSWRKPLVKRYVTISVSRKTHITSGEKELLINWRGYYMEVGMQS